jgi:hypothetical protein
MMRKESAFWAVLGVVAAGCSSGSSAVEGAFYSEHPYAHIDRSTTQSNADGSTSYEIAYTRADGTKATATYAPTGEIQKDQ